MKLDLETALLLLQGASLTDDTSRRDQNRRSARKAYDTIQYFLTSSPVRSPPLEVISEGLSELKQRLSELGECF